MVKSIKKSKRIHNKKKSLGTRKRKSVKKTLKRKQTRKMRGGSFLTNSPGNLINSFGTFNGVNAIGIASGSIPNVSSNVYEQPITDVNSKYNIQLA